MDYLKLLQGLDATEILGFKNYLKEHIGNLISNKNDNSKIVKSVKGVRNCPKCSCKLWKNGLAKNKVQKYICSNCRETISETTGTITYRSKKDFTIWKVVIDNLIDGLSIRRIAQKNKINKSTSFFLRHKILEALSVYVESVVLKGEIEADEKYVSINLKGMKPKKMPRLSKKRTSSAFRGISHHKICIATAIDEFDNLFMKIAGVGPITTDMLEQTYKNRIEKNSLLITDCKSSYMKFCKKNSLNTSLVKSGTYQNEQLKNLSTINNIHSQVEIWLSKFKNVSLKHLQNYLNWFSYILMMKRKYEANILDIYLYKDIISNDNYIKSNDIFNKEFPVDLKLAYGEYNYGIFAS